MLVENNEVIVSVNFPKIARLKAEYYEWIDDPHNFLLKLKSEKRVKADLFTFLQKVGDNQSFNNYHVETDSIADPPYCYLQELVEQETD